MVDVVVSEVAAASIATAINSQIAADKANTALLIAALEKYFGSAATSSSPGGITAAITAGAASQGDLLAKMDAQTKAINELIVAVGKVASSVEVITTAAANMQYTMTQQLTTQQLVAADQIKNNKFQQATTNAALKRAELPETEVVPDDMKKSVSQAVSDISVIKAQTAATSLITETLAETTSKAIKISTEWVAQTAFGKWMTSYYAEAKIQAQLLFADGESVAKLKTELETVRRARLMPTAVK